ncbi:MAG TPA: amidohydrolase family protein [Bacteroidales bacterium]|nr:amidohydrolase family protein [Bacteroidales bacterium]
MKKLFKFAPILIFMTLTACTQKEKADLIITNATVYTVDDNFSIARAIAVSDGKITAVGTTEEVLQHFSSDTILDLENRPVFPGFIDAHCHFLGYGTGLLTRADLTGTKSFDEILEIMKTHQEKFPSAFWLEGRGWDQNDWTEKIFPTNVKLNELFPDHPVLLTRIDGHAAIVNQKALELAGISTETSVEGGEIVQLNGELTGVLIDNAIDLVRGVIPHPDKEQIAEALLAAQEKCFAAGLTGVHDAGLEKNELEVIESLYHSGQLKMRINAMLLPSDENLETYMNKGITKTDHLTIRSIKLFSDGALGSRGAKLIKDYSDDPGNSGLLLRSPESLAEYCKKAYDKGFQVCTHAIGDSANRLMLKIYGDILKGKNDLRWRIEHAQIVSPEDFEKFGSYSVVPSVQPTHATSDMYWAHERVGAERIKGAYAYQVLMQQNGWIPLGTDFPIEDISPVKTFYAAVARKDLKGWPPGGFQPENALSRTDALRGMTKWAAKASFEENEKGSIEPGKFADFTVLDRDIMVVPEAEIPSSRVVMTFIGGEQVFSALDQ